MKRDGKYSLQRGPKATLKVRALGMSCVWPGQAGGCGIERTYVVLAVPTFEELSRWVNRDILAVEQISQKQEPDC